MILTRPTLNDRAATEEPTGPHLPKMIPIGAEFAPQAPADLHDTGVDRAVLSDLALKAAYTVPQFTTEWTAHQLQLPVQLVEELLQQLKLERMLEVLGHSGGFGYRYAISAGGRERANRLLEVSGYVGPAPVSLETYTAVLEWQIAHFPEMSPEDVATAISELVLTDEAAELAGLAVASGRSLFVFGPPGNGKTSLGRLLHNALHGDLWIPHCINIDSSIIRVFDVQCHQRVDISVEQPWMIDQRWVRIHRPLIIVGGELTIESLELAYSPALRYYEAPFQVKSNGGILLIDDFGRQRVDPHRLLNRWIIPLENQLDHLTLHTGQKIDVPFRQMLIFATNLDPGSVTDPAFLRRMGYRLRLDKPSPERYALIFERYAARCEAVAQPSLIARLLERYRAEGRELRSCEPRDLIERVRDICQFRGQSMELTEELLDLAWTGYFGNNSNE